MIVDVHTHIFPPSVIEDRDAYLAQDEGFRRMYSGTSARLATAEELLESMERAGVDRSVVLGFAWNDADHCLRHSEYLLEAASKSDGRLVPFCILHPAADGARKQMEQCAARGALGLGELRPALHGYGLVDSSEADLLAWAGDAYDLALMFHVSEPAGPAYPGKAGVPLEELARFVSDYSNVTVIASHWGAGLPFYALMPEVRETLSSTYVDTAAGGIRYAPEIYGHVAELLGPRRVLFGSGFPSAGQDESLRELREAPIDGEAKRLILGENARGLLRLR